jgi:hypothetical protein
MRYVIGLLATIAVFGSTVPCTLTAPCSFSIDVEWTPGSANQPTSPCPNSWGQCAVVQSQIPFVNVPAGYAVQILHVSGDEIAAPYGTMPPNTMAYLLVALTNTTPFQSPYVATGLGSAGTFVYLQGVIPQSGTRVPIEQDTIGTLNADNILIIKQSLFLSTTGVPEHMEATVSVRFAYTPLVGVAVKRK